MKTTHERLIVRFKEAREKLEKCAQCAADARAVLLKAEADHKAAGNEFMAVTIALAEMAAAGGEVKKA